MPERTTPTRYAVPVILTNIIGALVILTLVAWLLVAEAANPGQRPDQGPARGAIATPTAAFPR